MGTSFADMVARMDAAIKEAAVKEEQEREARRARRGLAAEMMPVSSVGWRVHSYLAEDGWVIERSVQRLTKGPYEGKYVVTASKPTGPGARGGRRAARQHKRVYVRGFATRKAADKRVNALYGQHSPVWAARRKAVLLAT